MSLLEVYWRALRYLAADRKRVTFICVANVVLAMVSIAEPIMFGRIIDAIADKTELTSTLAIWAGLGVFNIIAYVLVARGADRLRRRRAGPRRSCTRAPSPDAAADRRNRRRTTTGGSATRTMRA